MITSKYNGGLFDSFKINSLIDKSSNDLLGLFIQTDTVKFVLLLNVSV